jgi:hypothetical protein
MPRFFASSPASRVRAYSASGIEAHRWALNQFLGWANFRGFSLPSDFTRSLLEEYQAFLFHYRSSRTKQALAINTQLARLGAGKRGPKRRVSHI